MPRVFISYRRSDSSTISGRIYDHLARIFNDANVFKDVYDIPAGSDFRKVIEDNINACRAQLIIIGPTWLDTPAADGSRRLDDPNDAVRIEVESGLTCRDILLIPVLVSGASMPHPEQLPESIRDLSYRNAIVIRDDPDFRGDIDNLIKILRKLEERENSNRWRRRMPFIGVLVLIALVAGVGLLIASNSGTRFDLIVSNGTQTRIFSLALTNPVSARVTLTPSPNLPTATSIPLTATAVAPTASAVSAATEVASASTPDAAGAIQLIHEGDALQDQGSYPEALDRYTRAIALDPTNSEGYISRASVYATMHTDLDKAVEDAQTAIRIDPNNYWNYDELGKIYFTRQEYTLSVSAYTRALTLESNPSAYLWRGMAYHLLGDLPHALADLTKAKQLDPTNIDVLQEHGWTNFDAKNYADALLDFTAALERNDQSTNAYIGRGDAYRESGNIPDALADFTAALAIDPDLAIAYYERGYTYQMDGDNEAARADYLETIKRDDYYTSAYIQLARLELNDFHDPASALPYAQQAVDTDGSNAYAEAVLGDVYYEQGKNANALLHYRRYVELIGDQADSLYLTRIQELEGS
ncbi:MAG: tetratricopeptide repeat protein [Chloroflexi bacterium]|nr:tetratricopeptide repeat protein [Chloroflexota bacterium]